MKVLIFDTETTGLLSKKNTPHIVQLSYILFDTITSELHIENDIINVQIPTESSDIHGITNEISREKGISIKDAILKFINNVDDCDILVAHNYTFDKTMISIELERLNYPCYLNLKTNVYDTMIKGLNICNIKKINKNGKEYLKYPKLSELYTKLFNEDNSNILSRTHNAIIDVLVTLRCYLKMNSIENAIDFERLYNIY